MLSSFRSRAVLVAFGLVLAASLSSLFALPAAAGVTTIQVLFDLDSQPSTGCTVATPGGPFAGVEEILITTVETVPGDANVIAHELQTCTDPMAGTFSAPAPVAGTFMPPWPVGIGSTPAMTDVVETFWPLGVPANTPSVRVGIVSEAANASDTILDLTVPITDVNPIEIPTLSEWSLILLSLLLVVAAFVVLRRQRTLATGFLALAMVLVGVGVAWAAIVPDGSTADWVGIDPLISEPGDAPINADIDTVFATLMDTDLFLRFDMLLNVEPQADAQAVITDEDTPVDITLTGSDADGDPLTFAISTPPTNGALSGFDPATGAVTYTPATSFKGADSFEFTVDDGTIVSAPATVSIDINAVNDPPMFTSTPILDATEDVAYTYNATSTDPDTGDVLTVTAPVLPSWLMFMDNGGGSASLTGTPTNDDVGVHDVELRVTDLSGAFDFQAWQITVANVNDPPTFTSTPITTATEDVPYTYDVTATDIDVGDILTLSATVIPSWLGFIDNGGGSGTLSGTPAQADVGMHNVTLRVTDSSLAFEEQIFMVTVANVNDTPVFTSVPITSVDEDVMYTYNVTATDPDPGDVLTITAPTLPSWLMFVDNGGGSATLSGTPLQANVGMHDVTLTVTDTAMASSDQIFVITVIEVPDPPMIGVDPVSYATIGNTQLAAGGATASGFATVTDADGLLVKASINDPDTPPGGLSFTLETAATVGTAVVNSNGSFTYIPNAGATGPDSFQYRVSDGVASTVGTVNVTITDMVWYVKDDEAAGGDGRSTAPFNTLPGAEGASSAGDTIFVFEGATNTEATTLTTGITLKNDQTLHGQGLALAFAGFTPNPLIAAASNPTITNSSGDGITVDNTSGVTIQGLDVLAATGNGVAGTGVSTSLTIANAGFMNSGNDGVNLSSTGAGTAISLSTVTIDSSTGDGLDLADVDGSLTIDSTSGVTNNTLRGLKVDNSAGNEAFAINVASSAFDGNDGGVEISGITDNVTFDTVSINGSTGTALAMTNTTGNFTATNSTVGITGGQPFNFTGTTGTFDLSGMPITADNTTTALAGGQLSGTSGIYSFATTSITNPTAVGLNVIDTAVAGSTITFPTLTVNNAGAEGVVFNTHRGSFTASGGTIDSTVEGIEILDNGTATISFDNVDLTTDSGGGFAAIDGSNHTGAFNFTNGTITHSAGRAVDFDNMDGGSSFAGTTVTTTNHHGKMIVNSAGTHNLADVVVDQATPSPVNALHLDNNPTATINIGRVELHSNNARGLFANNSGTVNISNASSLIRSTGEAALHVTNTSTGAGWTFAEVDSTNSAGNGILLSSMSGNLTVTGGAASAISGAAGVAFQVMAGNGTVTYPGSINNSVMRSVEITNRMGGAVNLGGAITDTGAGIFLNSNTGSSNRFTGGMNLNTGTVTAFTATNGGVVEVSGGADVTTTTGRAVHLSNVAIGPNDVVFRSTNANGADVGILLENTGTMGHFEVSGIGATNGSGGTLQNITTDGVRLATVTDVRLRNLNIQNVATSGDGAPCGFVAGVPTFTGCHASVDMNAANTVLLDNVFIDDSSQQGVNGHNNSNIVIEDSTIRDIGNSNDENAVNLINLSGSNRIDRSIIRNPFENGVKVENANITSVSLTVTGTTIDDEAPIAGPGFMTTDALEMRIGGTCGGGGCVANLDVAGDVAANSISNTGSDGIQYTLGVGDADNVSGTLRIRNTTLQDIRTNGFNISAQGSGTMTLDIQNNVMNTGTIILPTTMNPVSAGTDGITVRNKLATVNGTIAGNTINDAGADAIDARYEAGNGSLTISGNTINGTEGGECIEVRGEAENGLQPDFDFQILNNVADDCEENSILVDGRGGVMTGVISGNGTVATPLFSKSAESIYVEAREVQSPATTGAIFQSDISVDILNNRIDHTGQAFARDGVRIRPRDSGAVCTFLSGNNSTATDGYEFDNDGTTLQLEDGVSASAAPATVVSDNGNVGTVNLASGTTTVVADNTCRNL